MISLDPDLVAAARQGSRLALERLVLFLQRPVFNLAVRMLGNRSDAEDATQEILIKMITHLGDVRDARAVGSWAFRIACRHLVRARRQGRVEAQRFTFRTFADDLTNGLEALPDETKTDPETQVLIEQVKVGCTLALLTCLSRPLRAAYILGEIFELSDTEAANALEIDQAAFRQRLRRARVLVTGFVQTRCGIVSPAASCRCERRVTQALRLGRVEKGRTPLRAQTQPRLSVAQVEASIAKLERGRAAAALMRSNPDFTTEIGRRVLQAMKVD
jgi:RNA polymerase sigma factor (sigma-70 family)